MGASFLSFHTAAQDMLHIKYYSKPCVQICRKRKKRVRLFHDSNGDRTENSPCTFYVVSANAAATHGRTPGSKANPVELKTPLAQSKRRASG